MGVGPRKHLAGIAGIDGKSEAPSGDHDVYVVEARAGDGWREVERTTSREVAENALDELAATQGIDLGDLRVRAAD
ncbi:MAG TPA: hypothetical protein VLA82_00715 [Actinomycetota bacterium]|nr:hypothetical protein [Actinomycetota bacterium]